MSTHNVYAQLKNGKSTAVSATVVVLAQSETGIHSAYGNTVPVDGTAGYAKACLFMHTDCTNQTDALYCNIGSVTSCDFNVATVAS